MKLTNEQNTLIKRTGVIQIKNMTILDKVQKKTKKIPVQVRMDYDVAMQLRNIVKKGSFTMTALFKTMAETIIAEHSKKSTKRN